jgi:uncharacterized membrane protein YhaH (DUF805 family)
MTDGRIFINYRREDSQGAAGRLYDHLLLHFERDKIFIDVDAIEPGVDFVDSLDKQVSSCRAFIAVIGPGWLGARSAAGQRRLDDPSDYVRIEIESALKRDIRVIPVLVDGGSMPPPSELPDSLQPLSRRNAVEISHSRFTTDCDQLAFAIKRALGMAAPSASAPKAAQTATQPIMLPPASAPDMPAPSVARPSIDQASAEEFPPARRSWPEVLFSFRGRISRKQFALGMLVVVVLGLALMVPILALTDQLFSTLDEPTQTATKSLADLLENRVVTVIRILLFWPSGALILKRLHDLGQGWMLFLVIVALVIGSTANDVFNTEGTAASGHLQLVYIGILFMLAGVKGDQGPNKYGPNPLLSAKES